MSPSDLVRPSERFKQLLADPRLRERFLPPMTGEEVAAVERLLDPVVEEVEDWCANSPILNPKTCIPLALLTIAPFLDLDLRAVALRIKAATWVYALDDLIDEGNLRLEELIPVLGGCLAAASVPEDGQSYGGELACQLVRLKTELESYPLFPLVHPFWASSLARLIDGMVFEHCLQTASSRPNNWTPSLDEYLYYARHSVANPHLMVAAIIVENDPLLVGALPELFRLAEIGGEAIRLSNDLATHRREISEGRINALSIEAGDLRRRNPQATDVDLIEQASTVVLERIARARRQAKEVASAMGQAHSMGQRFVRAMDLSVDLYLLGDYREWADLAGVKGSSPT